MVWYLHTEMICPIRNFMGKFVKTWVITGANNIRLKVNFNRDKATNLTYLLDNIGQPLYTPLARDSRIH